MTDQIMRAAVFTLDRHRGCEGGSPTKRTDVQTKVLGRGAERGIV